MITTINPDLHPTTKKIVTLLEEKGIWFEYFEHKPVRTSQEASKIRSGYSLHQGAKALIIRVKISKADKFFAMLVVPGDAKFDNNKVKAYFKAKDIRFASEKEVLDITSGILPGGVPPLGNLFGLRVVADHSMTKMEKIIFNVADRRASLAMRWRDYLTLVEDIELSDVGSS